MTAPFHNSAHVSDALLSLAQVLRNANQKDYTQEAARWICGLMGAQHAAVVLLNDEGVGRFVADTGLSENYKKAVESHFPWAPNDLSAKTLHIADVRTDPSLEELRSVLEAENIAAVTFVPLRGSKCLVGKVMAYFSAPTEIAESDLTVAEAYGEHIAMGIETMRAKQALKDQSDTYRALFDAVSFFATIHQHGKLVYMNQAVVSALGYDSDSDLIGKPALELIHPDDRPAVLERIKALYDDGIATIEMSERFLHRSGKTLAVNVTKTRIKYKGRDAIFVVSQDMTEKTALLAQAAQRDRLASLGQLAAMVGHDINNPLSYIRTNLEFATTRMEGLPEELVEVLGDALEGTLVIGRMTQELRNYVRNTDHDDAVNLHGVIAFVARMTSSRFRQELRLTLDVNDKIWVRGQGERITQVVMNLVQNAVQASSKKLAEVNVRAFLDADAVVLEVQDYGKGMSQGQIDTAFLPFVTTTTEGTGLGLYITCRLVEEMQGTICIESQVGEGTTVRVLLPKANSAPNAATQEVSVKAAPPKRAKVVLIDDDGPVLRGMGRLMSLDYDVKTFSSGQEALTAFLEDGEQADVIFCDVMMPGMSGPDVFQALRNAGREDLLSGFCFMTGGAFSTDASSALRETKVQVVYKPVPREKMTAVVESLLAGTVGVGVGVGPETATNGSRSH